jgi:hypothetical protein
MSKSKRNLLFALMIVVFSVAVLSRAKDPIRTTGDFFGDPWAYQSAVHFAREGFAASAYLMKRNFGPDGKDIYIHHAGFGTIPYALAVIPDLTWSVATMRCIAYAYFLVFFLGFVFWARRKCHIEPVVLLTVMLCFSNVLFLNFADILEGSVYFPPFIFWVLIVFEDIVHDRSRKGIYFLKVWMFFLLVLVDARFSHMSVILLSIMLPTDALLIVRERKRTGANGWEIRPYLKLLVVAVFAMVLSTVVYFLQTALALGMDFSAVFKEAAETTVNERGILERVSLSKIVFFIFVSPPHFLLACVGVIGFLLEWRCLSKEGDFWRACGACAVAGSGMCVYCLLFPWRFFQHMQYMGLILIMALYLPVAYVLLHWMRKLTKQRFWGRQSILPWCVSGAAACGFLFGVHFLWLQNKLRVCVPFDSAASFQRFIPEEASVVLVNSCPGPQVYIQRPVLSVVGIMRTQDELEEILLRRRSGVSVFAVSFEGSEFADPRNYLFSTMIEYYLSLLPAQAGNWMKARIPFRKAALDAEVTAYLEGHAARIARLPNGKGTLYRLDE